MKTIWLLSLWDADAQPKYRRQLVVEVEVKLFFSASFRPLSEVYNFRSQKRQYLTSCKHGNLHVFFTLKRPFFQLFALDLQIFHILVIPT